MDNDDDIPAPVGILGPIFDWTAEQQAAAERAEVPDNVIYLADYKLH